MARRTREESRRESRAPQAAPLPHPPCKLCADQVVIDYREADFLKKFMTERGRILGRTQTGACAWHQRQITRAIKRARNVQLLP